VHGDGGFSFGDFVLRQSALSNQLFLHDVARGRAGLLTVEDGPFHAI